MLKIKQDALCNAGKIKETHESHCEKLRDNGDEKQEKRHIDGRVSAQAGCTKQNVQEKRKAQEQVSRNHREEIIPATTAAICLLFAREVQSNGSHDGDAEHLRQQGD